MVKWWKGRTKEGELATTSLEFELHLQFPCGFPSTELSDFRQAQTFLLAKRPKRRGTRRNGCIRRLSLHRISIPRFKRARIQLRPHWPSGGRVWRGFESYRIALWDCFGDKFWPSSLRNFVKEAIAFRNGPIVTSNALLIQSHVQLRNSQ